MTQSAPSVINAGAVDGAIGAAARYCECAEVAAAPVADAKLAGAFAPRCADPGLDPCPDPPPAPVAADRSPTRGGLQSIDSTRTGCRTISAPTAGLVPCCAPPPPLASLPRPPLPG
ncbi:hypothetical protein Vafri_18527 [Volvox africanus]|uniref:Uncharacterized protein n=1 Tax=Volvox africanus TaxID=51714 RepID=A0A8J4BN87_9CHLO|nr:hypothetical protein Vafri_18527 [Volvox africanus]